MLAKSEKYDSGAVALKAPWEEAMASEWLRQLLRDNSLYLQGEVLKRLISGADYTIRNLNDELKLYGIPFEAGDPCSILLLRLDDGFRDFGSLQDATLEFAIGNIVEEILRGDFCYWRCKDNYGHIVYLVKARHHRTAGALHYAAEQIQAHIRTFLKGMVATAVSPQGYISDQLANLYRSALHAFQNRGSEPGECAVTGQEAKKRTWPGIVGRIQAYIRNHLSEDVSLQSLSEQVFLHPVYLSKLYKERTGEGLSDYILRVKMEHAAKLLLLDKSSKIYEIALQTGFQNQSYFSQVFKKWHGMTPQEYRKLHVPYQL